VRVLLVAEAANPEWVSVPLEGWSHTRAIARLVDAHVVTQVRNRDAFGRAGLADHEFTVIDNEALARPLSRLAELLRGGKGKGWTTVMALRSLAYRSFETMLWERHGPAVRAREYDLVHRVTPLSPTVPSRLATWCRRAGVPFVLGPLNGGVPWPRGFDGARRKEREWLSYLRGLHRLVPGYRSTRRDAAAILVGSRDTWKQLPERWRDRAVYVPENAIDPARFDLDSPLAPRADGPLRLAFVGRLVPYKGADMLLDAAAPLLRTGRATLDVFGDGPERATLEQQAASLGVASATHFAGWVPHEQLGTRLRQSDVFAFPSVREFGGAVVLEAMASGLVPVVLDYGGPGELVTQRTGFSLPMGTRAEIVARFRTVLQQVAADPAALAPMRATARRRVAECFTWDAKARQVLAVYEWVLGKRDKPDFGMPLPDRD
jgi:glycosyltransferase involved in cell wall biosynthesis